MAERHRINIDYTGTGEMRYLMRAMILQEEKPAEGSSWKGAAEGPRWEWQGPGVRDVALYERGELIDGEVFWGEAVPTRGALTGAYTLIGDPLRWEHGAIQELGIIYRWRNGEVANRMRVLAGVFPSREQESGMVFGGSPMMADVLAVMSRWGLSQHHALALMHEEG